MFTSPNTAWIVCLCVVGYTGCSDIATLVVGSENAPPACPVALYSLLIAQGPLERLSSPKNDHHLHSLSHRSLSLVFQIDFSVMYDNTLQPHGDTSAKQ